MTSKPKQIDKFKEAAKALETDNDEKRFDERLKRVANAASGKLSKEGGQK